MGATVAGTNVDRSYLERLIVEGRRELPPLGVERYVGRERTPTERLAERVVGTDEKGDCSCQAMTRGRDSSTSRRP